MTRAAGGIRAPARRAAAIDVGSNSVLLLVVGVDDDGRARAVDEALATTRLGTGLRPGGALDPAAAVRTGDAVVGFAQRARAAGAGAVWAFATGAARDAADGEAFVAEVGAAAAIPVELLSGDREAALAFAAAAAGTGGPELVADVGGRTTELTLGAGGAILEGVSLSLGALALTETCLQADPPSAAECARLRALIDGGLAAAPVLSRARGLRAVLSASGGTATALAALALGLARYEPSRVHGHVLPTTALAAEAERLASVPAAARAPGTCLDEGRAAILPAGALVLARVAAAAGAAAVRVSDHGVRHAYLRERLAADGVDADFSSLWA